MNDTNNIGSLLDKIVAWECGTGKVIQHETDSTGREVVRLKPLTGKQFPTDHFVSDIEII